MLEPGDNFGKIEDEYRKNSRSMLSFARYFTPYRSMIGQLVLAREANTISSLRKRLYKKVFDREGGAKEWDDFILSIGT